jgi:hypothetical protein
VVIVLAIVPKIRGSDPAEDDGFLRANKFIARLPSGGGEVKLVAPCRKI